MDLGSYLEQLDRDATLMVRAARTAGLDGAVPSCPRWQVRNLVQHTTKVHHWALSVLAGGDPQQFEFSRPGDDAVLDLLLTGVTRLAKVLRAIPADRQVWAMVPTESPVAFWARRLAHETCIHRVDAELAADCGVSAIGSEFATDGLDEVLSTMLPVRVALDASSVAFTATVAPLDANAAWTLTAGPAGVVTVAEARDASDLTVFGLAAELYRWVWNRAGDDEVALRGDLTLADVWRRQFTIGAR
jgi:uncharacterized protein (TIGR03083 family)